MGYQQHDESSLSINLPSLTSFPSSDADDEDSNDSGMESDDIEENKSDNEAPSEDENMTKLKVNDKL